MMKIAIPKEFYENKHSVTPGEFSKMFLSFMEKVVALEEDVKYFNYISMEQLELINKLQAENQKLREENNQLKRGLSA